MILGLRELTVVGSARIRQLDRWAQILPWISVLEGAPWFCYGVALGAQQGKVLEYCGAAVGEPTGGDAINIMRDFLTFFSPPSFLPFFLS